MTEGRCWVRLPNGKPLPVEAGDAVVLPHGDAHVIGSGTGNTIASREHAVALKLPERARMRYGGDGAASVLVCGWFAYERRMGSPVMAALPPMFRINVRLRPSGAWLESSIRYAVDEATSGRAGSDVMADKLAEVLFVEALRGYPNRCRRGRPAGSRGCAIRSSGGASRCCTSAPRTRGPWPRSRAK